MKFFGITALLLAASASAKKVKITTEVGMIGPQGFTPEKFPQAKGKMEEALADYGTVDGRRLSEHRKLADDIYIHFTPVPFFGGTGEYQFLELTPWQCPDHILVGNGYVDEFGAPCPQCLADSGNVCFVESWAYVMDIIQDGGGLFTFDCDSQASVKLALEGSSSTFLNDLASAVPEDPLPQDNDVCYNIILAEAVKIDIQSKVNTVREQDSNYSSGFTVDLLEGVSISGDPHVKTLAGKWFEYHGECDLVFMHAAGFQDGKDLSIHVRTSIRQSYSFITSAAVRLGESTLEVASYGSYALNGVDSADVSKESLEGFKIAYNKPNKKNTIFEITLTGGKKIVLSAFKDLVAVKMEGFGSEFANASGLLGTVGGKLLGRDGVTEFTDMNAFGQEWQVRDTEPMLFRSARAPQFPTETCRLPKVSMEDTRRRLGEGMAREQAERACAHFSGVQFENCVFDVMAVGDIDLAQAGAY